MISIADANSAPELLKKYAGHSWVYIGGPKGLARVNLLFPTEKRIYIGKILAELSRSCRSHLVNFIAELSTQQPDQILWYSSRVASKSMSQTTIFHQYLYQKLLQHLNKSSAENIIVVSDNAEFLKNTFDSRYDWISVVGNKLSFDRWADCLKGYRKIFRYLLYKCFFSLLKKNTDFSADLLIHNWIDQRVFATLPEFCDLNLGNLGRLAQKENLKVGRLAALTITFKDARQANQHFSNVYLPLMYLSWRDLWKGFRQRFSIKGLDTVKTSTVDGELLARLTKNEETKENNTRVYLDYYLAYFAYRALAEKFERRGVMIYPFENQPWEKMLNVAFADWHRVGYLHAVIPENWLDYRSSPKEKMPLPQQLFSLGKVWTDFLRQEYPNLPVEEVGAIRFEYLFAAKPSPRTEKIILVVLPLNEAVAEALLRDVEAIVARNSININSYKVIIKSHPYLSRPRWQKDLAVHKNCSFSAAKVGELLQSCEMLICSDSTVLYEAVCCGKKTIAYIAEDVQYGLEWAIADYVSIAYSDTLECVLKGLLAQSSVKIAPKEQFFSPPNYEKMLQHIKKHVVVKNDGHK